MKKSLHYLFMIVSLLAVPQVTSSKDYSGGELYTLKEFQYGKFEARMKMAAASGTVNSMFLYQNDSYLPGSPWVEVDIEFLGKNPSSFLSNIITGKAGAQKTSEKYHALNPAADQAFHTYAIEWTPNYVRFSHGEFSHGDRHLGHAMPRTARDQSATGTLSSTHVVCAASPISSF